MKIYELEQELERKKLHHYTMKLKELVEIGYNGIYEDYNYLGYEIEDFDKRDLEKQVIVLDTFLDSHNYTCINIRFLK